MKNIGYYLIKLNNTPLYQKVIGSVFTTAASVILDLKSIIFSLWFLVFINSYFGIKKELRKKGLDGFSVYRFWITIKSVKLQRAIDKGASYLLVLVCVWLLNERIIDVSQFNIFKFEVSLIEMTAGVLAFKELWSVGEKFAYLYNFNPIKIIFSIFKNKSIKDLDKNLENDENNRENRD